jgi:allantoicase
MASDENIPEFTTRLVNLALAKLGAEETGPHSLLHVNLFSGGGVSRFGLFGRPA